MLEFKQRGTPSVEDGNEIRGVLQPHHNEDPAPTSLQLRSMEDLPPEKCRCCFTLQGAVISSLLFLILIATIILTLDLTILEVERSKKLERQEFKLRLEQDGGTFEEEFYYRNFERLKEIELTNVEANITTLIKFIHVASRLEVIRLRKMTFTGKIPKLTRRSSYFYVNNLKEFTLDLSHPIGPDQSYQLDSCDTCVIDTRGSLDNMRQLQCLRALLLFVRSELDDTILPPRLAETKFQITMYGWTLLKILPETGEVTSMFRNCDLILTNILDGFPKFIFRKLALNGCENLDVTILQRILNKGSLTHLTLDEVTLSNLSPGQRMSELFKNATALEEIILKYGSFFKSWDPPTEYSDLNRTRSLNDTRPIVASPNVTNKSLLPIDFSDFPKSVKKVGLFGVGISRNSSQVNLSLDTLLLIDVRFEDDAAFLLFKKTLEVRKLGFSHSKPKSSPPVPESLPFLHELMGNGVTEWILFHEKFPFPPPPVLSLDLGNDPVRTREYTFMSMRWDHWLLLMKRNMSNNFVPSHLPYVLSRAEGSRKWEMQRVNSEVAELHLWFQLLNIQVFLNEEHLKTRVW